MPIDDSKYSNVFYSQHDSYTGDHVKKQLQYAFRKGHDSLYKALKKVFTEKQMYEAAAILKQHEILDEREGKQ